MANRTSSSVSPSALNGTALIAGKAVLGTGPLIYGQDPVTGQALDPPYPDSSPEDLDRACRAAEACFDDLRSRPREQRAQLLHAMAEEILALGDALLDRAGAESGLPRPRLEGERARTVGQLQLFAEIVRAGDYLGREHDAALPDRKPLPRPDLRLQQIPLGPVAVFGASNFPLAFSVAGGDTASALAAGCPVIVKAHPAHPGTSELVAVAVGRAIQRTGMPAGSFSMLHGHKHQIGETLAKHPSVCAIAFTGSRRGGLALMALAAQRAVPIPVYAEMSSINPVFLLPGAVAKRGPAIAQAYADSLTLGTGQFCTQPGLVFALRSPAVTTWLEAAAAALGGKEATPMLSSGICAAYTEGIAHWQKHSALTLPAQGLPAVGVGHRGQAALFSTDIDNFQQHPELAAELFGPSSLVVLCKTAAKLLEAAETLEGQLTATLQMEPEDLDTAQQLVPVLERKAGRILVNGFPTGVEVGYAMSHGGPFPATSDGRSTSVGAHAIDRFLRPVCYQNFPPTLLPFDLQNLPQLAP